MKMEAVINLRLVLPFDAEVDELVTELDKSGPRLRLADPEAHEKEHRRILRQRRNAAKQAEDLAKELSIKGAETIGVMVEEVRQA
jgi:hypothetical protein